MLFSYSYFTSTIERTVFSRICIPSVVDKIAPEFVVGKCEWKCVCVCVCARARACACAR